MAWHLEDNAGVVLSGHEDICTSWFHKIRQQDGSVDVNIRGILRLINHNGLVVATFLGHDEKHASGRLRAKTPASQS